MLNHFRLSANSNLLKSFAGSEPTEPTAKSFGNFKIEVFIVAQLRPLLNKSLQNYSRSNPPAAPSSILPPNARVAHENRPEVQRSSACACAGAGESFELISQPVNFLHSPSLPTPPPPPPPTHLSHQESSIIQTTKFAICTEKE